MKKRILSVVTCVAMILQLTACGLSDAASKAHSAIADWYQAIDLSNFKDGWDRAADYASATFAATMSSQYVENVGKQINALRDSMDSVYGSARSVAQEAGFVAEKWAAGTFNIDAAARQSEQSAAVVGSNKLGSVDVATSYGENASLKYYNTPSGSAQAQATSVLKEYSTYNAKASSPVTLEEYLDKHGKELQKDDLYASIYEGQTRIIPSDQLENAVDYLKRRSEKLRAVGGSAANSRADALQEALSHLRDRLEAPDGTSSKPATYEEMQAIAELSQKGKFVPEDFGISTSAIITPKYILKQAMGAGTQSATINAALSLGPDVYAIICEAVKTGVVNLDDVKEAGIGGVLAGSGGFAEGSISAALVAACQAGKFGTGLVNASPDIIGTLTVLVINAIRYGYALAKGEITPENYGDLMAENIVVSAGALGGGAVVSLLLPAASIACMAGCLAGGMIASIGYTIAKEVILEIKDGGGFAAIVPAGVLDTIDVAKSTVADLHLVGKASELGDLVIATVSEGWIKTNPSL